MTQTNRFSTGGQIQRGHILTSSYLMGKRYKGHAGDTLASGNLY